MSNNLNRRYIKSFASGLANMFAGSALHYAWLALHHQIRAVTIDLLELRIEPTVFDIERNRILAGMCRDLLLRNIRRLASPGAVVAAKLSAHFGIDTYIEGVWPSIGMSTFIVELTDDRGKVWRIEYVEKRLGVDAERR
ncbi:hypothetical protein [Chrysiogenes arsenatis]|uniref:hypothetical protein n=1 Tax=Chrysiogenes arsenatis TaxID=309797 RepID=UPI0004197AFB|nr:hypothetical protein [Chrysiogenes arsenatis]